MSGPHDPTPAGLPGGPISFMARNPVAANLLMILCLVGGLLGATRIKQEVFPEFSLDTVFVTLIYPGAAPEEVEQGIVLAVEEAVRGVDGVKRVTSSAGEGVGTVAVELLVGADPDKVLADVKTEVDAIRSFPEEAERPTVVLATNRPQVVSLVLYGDLDLRTLHDLAEEVRYRLLESPDITQVDVRGVPPLEVQVEVDRATLESLALTLDEVARQIRLQSLELPGGEVETRGGDLLVRVSDRAITAEQFGDLLIRGTAGGAQVRLADVATIRDGFADTDQETRYGGQRAVRLTAYRIGDETPISVSKAVRALLPELQAELPPTVQVAVWDDDSELLAARMDLLLRNARFGLVLVLVVLALFLDLRLAFWTAVGIPVSFLGTFLLMPYLGVSINMISLFAFIITLGIVVDDAIVVCENAFQKVEAGVGRLQAAIEGTREMAVPVTFSVLTTLAAFAPLLLVPGVSGKLFRITPLVVITVLVFSLLESFFMLPAHLAHMKEGGLVARLIAPVERVQRRVAAGLKAFIAGPYRRTLDLALSWRHATLAIATGLFLLSVGTLASGLLPFAFFPQLEGDVVTATVRLPYGAPAEVTQEVARQLEASARVTVQQLTDEAGRPVAKATFTSIGSGPPGGFGVAGESGSHLLTMEQELVPSAERTFTSEDFARRWKENTPPLAGVEVLSFSGAVGPGAGAAVDVQLSHPDTAVLARASDEVAALLRSYTDLTNVENGFAAGKPQLDFSLLPAATTLGLTSNDLARQLRAAFYGAEALREQRGRNEVKVMVRLPEAQRRSEDDLEQLRIRAPGGGYVPIAEVASFERDRAPTTITREEGRRTVNVSGDLAPGVPSAQATIVDLEAEAFPALRQRYPGLTVTLVGEQQSQQETFASLGQNYLLALIAIYALLAVPFRSYVQPLVIMSAIPFGFIGPVVGHLLLGYQMSIISMFGLVALSGVIVNDSLVLVDAYNRLRAGGLEPVQAIREAGMSRFRPILLTSLTTFAGLAPMIAERSVQARFLIPMAISLGFGVLVGTFIALLVVPALLMILEDFVALGRRLTVRGASDLTTGPADPAV